MENTPPLPPVPTTNLPPTKVWITVGSQTADPDRTLRAAHAQNYPIQVWYFLASFIFLLALINYTGRVMGYYLARVQRRQLSKVPNESSTQMHPARGSINLLRLPQALADTLRALSFRWTIPIGRSYTLNVTEVVLAAAYIVICLAWSLINTTSTKGVKFDPHYYANIAGNIATIQFPLVVALGMKNNIISCEPHVDRRIDISLTMHKLVYMHGVTSRVLVVLVWLHAGGRIQLGLEGKVAITVPVIQAGVLAGVALTLLSIVSIRPIRDKAYEFFLVVHLGLAIIIILAGYFHAASLGFGQFMWPAILLWGLDRFLRILRVAINTIGRKKLESPPTGSGTIVTNTQLELLSPSFLRLTVPTPRFFSWSPGQSVYLTFPGISANPLEAHPFTIATIDSNSKNSGLKFFIRVRNGVTRRLFDSVENGNDVKVLLDGPYSSPPRLVGYDTVLLIAGGSGIAFTLPLFLDLVERSRKQGPACRRLTLAWTIRNIEHVIWIQSELLSALQELPSGLALEIHIFITGTTETNAHTKAGVEGDPEALDDDTNSESDQSEKGSGGENANGDEKSIGNGTGSKTGKSLLAHPLLKIHQGRADLDKYIKEEVSLAKDVMSVTVCGTHALASAVRKATRYPRMADILKGGPTISLHVEAFGKN